MTPPPLRLVLLLLGLGVLASTSRAEATFDVTIPRQARETFDEASFHLWLPDNAGPVRGVAVVLDGINVDGRHLAGRKQWQDFAQKNSLALVACYFRTDDLSIGITYSQAEFGSGRALLAGLTGLGKASGHPEMDTVPLFLLGFSAGGQFSYSFANFCPERTAAFVSNKGGIYQTPATEAARAIPGLFIMGEKDTASRRSAIRKIFSDNRQLGANWFMAVEPKYAHNTANANDLALPFFEAVMRRRERPAAERAGIVLDLDHHRMILPGIRPRIRG